MGINGKFLIVIIVIATAVGISSYLLIQRSHNELIEVEAVRIANIVSTQIVSDRAEYTKSLVGKLKRDGTGADRHSSEKKGFILLPAQFVRNVSKRVEEQAKGLYSYSLISGWNLNEEQGLETDFDRWAWSQFTAQEKEFLASGNEPGKNGYDWKPVYRFENIGGQQVLHYMRPDPASAASCVSCHNAYEQKPDVIAMREAAGVTPGKSWELHQLMGGISVKVPVHEVAAMAATGRNKMMAAMGGVFVLGFSLLFVLIRITIIKPVATSVAEVVSFSGKVDDVVGCSRELLLGADEQYTSCKDAKATSCGAGQDAGTNSAPIVETLDGLMTIASNNAMRAEESAVHCGELDSSFKQLKTRLEDILGTRENPSEKSAA